MHQKSHKKIQIEKLFKPFFRKQIDFPFPSLTTLFELLIQVLLLFMFSNVSPECEACNQDIMYIRCLACLREKKIGVISAFLEVQALTTLMLILLEVSTTFKRGAAEVKRRCCCCCRLRWGKSSVELLSKLLSKPRDRSPPVLDYNPDLTRSGTTVKRWLQKSFQ